MKISSRAAPTLSQAVVAACASLLRDLLGTYRPERHYMRGPGPKWRAKHSAPRGVDRAVPVATRHLIEARI